jgi:anthranilate phosphoribosyltransferase
LLEGCADRALLDTVVLNAAAALTVAGVEAKLSDGAERARAAIADGRAAAVFERAAAINRGAS